MFKNNSKKRLMILLVSLSALLVIAVGGTLAYVFMTTDALENIFTPAQVSCAVVENGMEYTGNVVSNVSEKKNVTIKNTGNTDAYIRVDIVVNWKNATSGNVYAQAPELDTDYTMSLGSGWKKGSDGYYYYTSAIAPSHETGALIAECKPGDTTPDGYVLSVEIVASAIQSKPDSVVESAWLKNGVVGDANNGVLTIK